MTRHRIAPADGAGAASYRGAGILPVRATAVPAVAMQGRDGPATHGRDAHATVLFWLVLVLAVLGPFARPATAQEAPKPTPAPAAEGSPVVEVVVEGNDRVSTNRILAQMKLRQGSIYTPEAANEDFKRVYALGEFENVVITPEPVEGGVRLRVTVTELPLLAGIEFDGAKHVDRDKLLELTGLRADAPESRHKLLSAVPVIVDEFKRRGYYFVDVHLDEATLAKKNVARYVISEGPKVRVKSITFRGNASISANELQKQLETKKEFWPFTSGTFSEEILRGDVARIRAYYISQGFFDAEVSRQFTFDEKNEKVEVEFIISEGPRYKVASVSVLGSEALPPASLTSQMRLAPGKYYTEPDMKADRKLILDRYGRIGYVHAEVTPKVQFTARPAEVDIVYQVSEGSKVTIGEILISGNTVTQDRVILRELGVAPTEVADATKIAEARDRLIRTQIFGSADVELQPTDDPHVENLAVHVEEGRTAQFLIGAGVSSNSGLIGNIALSQRNFDIANWPTSWNDPDAFRGAGQTMRLVLEPGTERQQYSLGWTEPYLFDRPIRLDTSGSYFTRVRESYDEERLGGQFSLGKTLARDLHGSLGFRMEAINIDDIETDAPSDVFKVKGSSYLSSVTVGLTRDKTDNYFVPTTGSRVSVSVEQAGALGGDYTHTKFIVDGRRYWTVTEDALGRRSVFSLHGRTGFAPGHPPIFERFYAGGQGTIRGFRYRGVGPVENDEPIGGDFLLLLGGEYEFPIYGKNFSGVFFVDTGTVEKTTTLTTYRASTGFGLRFTVDMLGAPVPFALDFGFPLAKDKDDETQVFSFSIAWSI